MSTRFWLLLLVVFAFLKASLADSNSPPGRERWIRQPCAASLKGIYLPGAEKSEILRPENDIHKSVGSIG